MLDVLVVRFMKIRRRVGVYFRMLCGYWGISRVSVDKEF